MIAISPASWRGSTSPQFTLWLPTTQVVSASDLRLTLARRSVIQVVPAVSVFLVLISVSEFIGTHPAADYSVTGAFDLLSSLLVIRHC